SFGYRAVLQPSKECNPSQTVAIWGRPGESDGVVRLLQIITHSPLENRAVKYSPSGHSIL
uniref:Uncharacterized protein n=1 Tax=Canis lupus dingo TaxID=286419 RepID=A0A8C0QZC2_CANLU